MHVLYKKISSSKRLLWKGIFISLIFGMASCKTVAKKKSHWEIYKQAKSGLNGNPDYNLARSSLETIINDPTTDHKTRSLTIKMLAGDLFLGVYGYYDEKGFVYWVKARGSDADDWKSRMVNVNNVRSLYNSAPSELHELYSKFRSYCLEDDFLVKDLNDDLENLALQYLNSVNCTLKDLFYNKEIQLLYSKHIEKFSSLENKKEMARGFKIYNTTDYQQLTTSDRKAILLAKIQALKFLASPSNMKFKPHKNIFSNKFILEFLNKLESDNDSDWSRVKELSKKILEGKYQNNENIAYIYSTLLYTSYIKNRLRDFIYYTEQVFDIEALTLENRFQLEIMKGLIFLKNNKELEALVSFDEVVAKLLELKKKSDENS